MSEEKRTRWHRFEVAGYSRFEDHFDAGGHQSIFGFVFGRQKTGHVGLLPH